MLRFHIDPIAPNLFPEPPDFESPDDADTDNDYAITLLARVGMDVSTFPVTVTVADVDEAGVISLSSAHPSTGSALTATLTDPDMWIPVRLPGSGSVRRVAAPGA